MDIRLKREDNEREIMQRDNLKDGQFACGNCSATPVGYMVNNPQRKVFTEDESEKSKLLTQRFRLN